MDQHTNYLEQPPAQVFRFENITPENVLNACYTGMLETDPARVDYFKVQLERIQVMLHFLRHYPLAVSERRDEWHVNFMVMMVASVLEALEMGVRIDRNALATAFKTDMGGGDLDFQSKEWYDWWGKLLIGNPAGLKAYYGIDKLDSIYVVDDMRDYKQVISQEMSMRLRTSAPYHPVVMNSRDMPTSIAKATGLITGITQALRDRGSQDINAELMNLLPNYLALGDMYLEDGYVSPTFGRTVLRVAAQDPKQLGAVKIQIMDIDRDREGLERIAKNLASYVLAAYGDDARLYLNNLKHHLQIISRGTLLIYDPNKEGGSFVGQEVDIITSDPNERGRISDVVIKLGV